MNKFRKPHLELWSAKDVEEMAQIVYSSCLDKDCDACDRRLEVDDSCCHNDLIGELWRKWRNAEAELAKVKAERDAAIEDIELLIHDDCMEVCDLCDRNPHGARCKEACAEAHWRGVQNEPNRDALIKWLEPDGIYDVETEENI